MRVDICCCAHDPETHRCLRSRLDRRLVAWWLAAAAAHAALLALLAVAVPRLEEGPEPPVRHDEVWQLQLGIPGLGEPEFEEPAPTDMLGAYPSPVHQPDGARCGGQLDLGGPELVAQGHYGITGPKDNPDPHLARHHQVGARAPQGQAPLLPGSPVAPLDARESDTDTILAAWGRDDSLGTHPRSVQGTMWAEDFGTFPGVDDGGKIHDEGGRVKGVEVVRHARVSRARPPRVVHFQIDVAGEREPAAIERGMVTHLAALRDCYRTNPESQGDSEGRVDLAFRIRADGSSQDARAVRSQGVAPAIVACMTEVIDGLAFPSSHGSADVTYPLLLMPGRSEETVVASRPIAPPIAHEPWRSPCGGGRRPAEPVAPCSR